MNSNDSKTTVTDNGDGTLTIKTTTTMVTERKVNADAYKKTLETKQTKIAEITASQATEIKEQLAVAEASIAAKAKIDEEAAKNK